MEFGALQCIPKSPDCRKCPINTSCFAVTHNMIKKLPVKSRLIKNTIRFFYYYIIVCGDYFLLQKRTENDIWKNMYQFPLIETKNEISDAEILQTEIPWLVDCSFNIINVSDTKKHQLTHQTIYARFIFIETNKIPLPGPNFFKVHKKDIFTFAVPRLLEPVIKNISNT
jgi:A/G-specific adenine glycosylase